MANGEVMNRVRSFLLEPTFANREGMAPEDVARRRAMAEALWSQGNSSQPVVGVFDGMNRVLQSFLGGRQMRKAEDADQFIRQREDQQQQAGLQQMAAFAYPNQTTTEPPTTRPLATPTYGAGTQNEWSAGDWPGGAQTTAPGTGIDAGVRLLDQYEGFSGTPYDDWSYRPGSGERYNSGQRIGYGQTLPGQTSITQEQAQQLLRQQIETEYVPSIVNTIGPERWSSFTPDQQGVLISLVHNYGSLPNRILDEIATGDPQAIAGAITALGEDNQGINRNRRTGEAAYFAGTPGERTTTTANPVGEFVQGLISNPQTRGVAAQLIGDQITRLTTPPAPVEPIEINGQLVDPVTRQVVGDYRDAPAPADREVRNDQNGVPRYVDTGDPVFPGVDASPTPINFGDEEALRDNFRMETSDYRLVQGHFQRLQAAAANPSAAGDIAMIFAYMKMLDPGSVVRETEYATAQNAAGVPTIVQNIWNRLVDGQRLAPEQRADFLGQAQALFTATEQQYAATEDRFRSIAEQYGMDPNRLFGEDAPTPALRRGPAPMPAGAFDQRFPSSAAPAGARELLPGILYVPPAAR